MKTNYLIMILGLGIGTTFGAFSCGGEEEEQDTENPKSSDDTTQDSDSQSDDGVGTDTNVIDSETESDTTPKIGASILPVEGDGWIDGTMNPFKMQGSWYTFGCPSATVEPLGQIVRTPGKGMCFKGSSPVVVDGTDTDTDLDWGDMWGAGIGFNVCSTPDEEETDSDTEETRYAMSMCPYNDLMWKADEGGTVGIQVDITGSFTSASGATPSNALRIMFNEGDNVTNAYVEVSNIPGTTTALFKAASVGYDPSAKPEGTVPGAIMAIQFQTPTDQNEGIVWDLCIEDVRMLSAADVPAEDTDSSSDSAAAK